MLALLLRLSVECTQQGVGEGVMEGEGVLLAKCWLREAINKK